MRLTQLRLYNFKNYEEVILNPQGRIHCLMGHNGSGKTNLLDAIHYLSFTKSAFNSNDALHVRRSQEQFYIQGEFKLQEQKHSVRCAFALGKKKALFDDEIECTRFSRHIGKYPVVLLSPHDMELIWDGSEMRRKFMDSILSQLDGKYLDTLIVYTNQLKQRNSYLRSLDGNKPDMMLMESYNVSLAEAGEKIYKRRKAFLNTLVEDVREYYHFLSGGQEPIDLVYRSDQDEMPLAESLTKNLARDILLQRTNAGIHRDDFLFMMEDAPLQHHGSQGQQKSFLIALKLAECKTIATHKNNKPLLLLDDIFDKLDDQRIGKLIELTCDDDFGQLFLTDARPERCRFALGNRPAEYYNVQEGKILLL